MFGEDQFQDVQRASRKSALWTLAAFFGIVVTLRIGRSEWDHRCWSIYGGTMDK